MAERKMMLPRIGQRVHTSGGIGYVEALAQDNSYLIKYRRADRDKGLVEYEFASPCLFRIEARDDIEWEV